MDSGDAFVIFLFGTSRRTLVSAHEFIILTVDDQFSGIHCYLVSAGAGVFIAYGIGMFVLRSQIRRKLLFNLRELNGVEMYDDEDAVD